MSSTVRWYEVALALVPFAIGVASLGALGIAAGASGSALSLAVVQTSKSRRTKIAGCVASTIGAAGAWATLAALMR
jgi:hypothetical protein